MITLVHLVVSLGMLVVVPLGLALVELPRGTALRRWWPAIAVPGVVALWLPRGPVSVTLAAIYFAGTLGLASLAVVVLRDRLGADLPAETGRKNPRGPSLRRIAPTDVALLTALVTPSIAALALVAERASYELFGFSLTVLSLTVAHFHFAGFAAALVACLVAGATHERWTDLAALTVPAGTVVVLLGFFVGDWLELIGAAVLTTGMWLVGYQLWRRARSTPDRATAVLLGVSGAVLVATMLLALSWALGHVVATPYLPLEWMVATHGVANAVGFALCGLLGWRRLAGRVR
ncbi:YndJ-like protein [Kribbella amoyensis]|uniref:YndJ-like protein n=1 Tax=Kribbella amoyensis TaxID=996641 RepID=A0A561BSD4_9ACTN|nr:YndJ family protein [Kribbella amoyensis]TWD81795.1 YndJ-like protein [Kribbella amoyensis]